MRHQLVLPIFAIVMLIFAIVMLNEPNSPISAGSQAAIGDQVVNIASSPAIAPTAADVLSSHPVYDCAVSTTDQLCPTVVDLEGLLRVWDRSSLLTSTDYSTSYMKSLSATSSEKLLRVGVRQSQLTESLAVETPALWHTSRWSREAVPRAGTL
jgi:hypothetical protein